MSTMSTPKSKLLLEQALSLLSVAVSPDQEQPKCLYRLSYQQSSAATDVHVDGNTVNLPPLPLDLAFNDSVMDQVRAAWDVVTQGDEPAEDVEYMNFDDREGVIDEDERYE